MATTSPVVRRRRLGLELRALREATGMTGEEAVRVLGWSNSKLSRMENGRNPPSPTDLGRLLDLFEVHDDQRREELSRLLREAKRKGWWQIYSDVPYSTMIGLEAEAATLLAYEAVVPGLLQTEEYARAIITGTSPSVSEETLDQRVEVRMTRQAVLTKRSPLQVRAVLDESAIRRLVGSPAIMRGQLLRLLKLSELPNVIIQVVPFANGAHPGTMLGDFNILEFEHSSDPGVVYAENHTDPYPDREGDLQRYKLAFDHIRAAALSVSQTATLLRELTASQ
ncbi:helix-turn-helix domain-containing protein [Streptacidiphilus sp. 4-A2]|jgi:transcriptional regulator with XRE-family HTH domain|nr:helix-turn-helix domain-containing protein [Streptacidiphilus sp. 4-A2]